MCSGRIWCSPLRSRRQTRGDDTTSKFCLGNGQPICIIGLLRRAQHMITDSPYEVSSHVLSPRMGVGVGLVAALVMLAPIQALEAMSGFSVKEVFLSLGGLVWSSAATLKANGLQQLCGLALHLTVGAIFGLLYAVCQQHTERRSLIAVGLFYGVLLWIGGSLFVGSWVDERLRVMLRSWSWLAGCVVYGLCLAFAAICRQGKRSGGVPAQPLD